MDTVEVKTSELIGAALDWAVGYAVRSNHLGVGSWQGSREAWLCDWSVQACYSPSTDWADGGPLIDKYQLDLTFERKGLMYAYQCQDDGLPIIVTEDVFGSYGPTHLIAVCRAIVNATLGETVSIPSELMQ